MTPTSIALNRFGLGARPDDRVGADPRGWLADQLRRYVPRPSTLASSVSTREAAAIVAEFKDDRTAIRKEMKRNGRSIRNRGESMSDGDGNDAGAMRGKGGGGKAGNPFSARRREYGQDMRSVYGASVGARVNTALATDTPFVERLVYFWSNHFALSAKKPDVRMLAGGYEVEAIRPHVMGNFRDLLQAADHHPAMLIYLDQARSAGPDSALAKRRRAGLNENLAREIMELHTLGARTGYTQADVTEFARALTGWTSPELIGRAGEGTPGEAAFLADWHQPGARTIMGKTYPAGGAEQSRAVMDDLARNPATARHIATKLTRHFAGSPEPAAMIDRLATAFTRSNGDLPSVYRALIESPEAWVERPVRFRTPWDWAIATMRAGGPRALDAEAALGLFTQLGQPVWQPSQPSGWDDDDGTWAAADGLIRRVEAAERMASARTDPVDARKLAETLWPGAVTPSTAQVLQRAESPAQALALLFVAPEMMRR